TAAWAPWLPVWTYPWIGCVAGVAAGAALGLLLGFFHLELGADLIVAGVGINILASGLTVLLMAALVGDKGSTSALTSYPLPNIVWPYVSDVPLLGPLLNGDGGRGHHVLTYAAFAATALVAWVFYRTPFGLRLRAVGESPVAARQVGLSVPRIQYLSLLASGVLAGLGGVFLSMGYLTFFQADMTAGRGYLALAIVYLGARQPVGTAVAALAFGGFAVMAAQLGYFAIPSQIILMIPPIVTILALVAFARRGRAASVP
ncbi:MAG: ABC transporter permease, partial [Pseudomonadota bacterium]